MEPMLPIRIKLENVIVKQLLCVLKTLCKSFVDWRIRRFVLNSGVSHAKVVPDQETKL